MAIGPGKYDVLATAAREAANANGVVLIILDGEYGNGFSAQLSRPDRRAGSAGYPWADRTNGCDCMCGTG